LRQRQAQEEIAAHGCHNEEHQQDRERAPQNPP
jgi:hypothetical protein